MDLTPKKIVKELDKHIIGQLEAKRAVAVALRSRILRKKITSSLKDEIMPKNILMIGPTGVGKTEIARRLAKIINAPFIKVEATKYTEIGYVGKDVESIIRDLVEMAVKNLIESKRRKIETIAKEEAKVRIIKEIVGSEEAELEIVESLYQSFDEGKLDDTEIEIEVDSFSGSHNAIEMPMGQGVASIGMIQIGDLFGKMTGQKKRRKMPVREAKDVLTEEIIEEMIDTEDIAKEALRQAEEDGIVFIDEIDKIAFSNNAKGGEVSREGVQRDLLPLIEGTTVQTKYGNIKTDHILFIGSGAFYSSKPSDLSPELQGRFPVRVELKSLSLEDMVNILTQPEASLIKQYKALLKAEGITLEFTEEGILSIAKLAIKLNSEIENIGARRLYTLLEKILHDLMFEAGEMKAQKIMVDENFVEVNIKGIPNKIDLAKFIL